MGLIEALKDMWSDQQAIGDAKHEAFMQHPVIYMFSILAVSAIVVCIGHYVDRRR